MDLRHRGISQIFSAAPFLGWFQYTSHTCSVYNLRDTEKMAGDDDDMTWLAINFILFLKALVVSLYFLSERASYSTL